jgi:PAS domain S-box-containing protein
LEGSKPVNIVRVPKLKTIIPSIENVSQFLNGHFPPDSNMATDQIPDNLHQKAFDNSFLPNIISIVGNGKIIAANRAAEKLLGYPAKGLLTKNFDEIFTSSGGHFEKMLKYREAAGHSTGDLTVVKKNGKQLPCQITSVLFTGGNGVKKAITTLVDRSEGIRRQSEIDLRKEKKSDAEIIFALSKSDATLHRMHDLEHLLDKEITAKEVSLSASLVQREFFEKEWQSESKLKAIQIANAISEAKQLERSDLGKELHDNVNQLLAASRIFMDLAQRNSKNRKDNISRSSEYTLIAIEEIRKIAKGLVNNAIKNVGLCFAVKKMVEDLVEVYPVKIICKMDETLHVGMSEKFNLDVFRIVQEQLNNIIKHAKASRIRIDLTQNEAEVMLTVVDNGIGFDVTKNVDGIGIINIKSRAEFYKGSAVFVSKPGKGCVLTARFPIEYAIQKES